MRIIVAANLILLSTFAQAEVRITSDSGGRVAEYDRRVEAARWSKDKIVVDGRCASACTRYLTLPPDQVCATARAVFVFHTVTTELGTPDWRANDDLLRAWPPRVRYAILRRGGLWLAPVAIPGRQLVPPC